MTARDAILEGAKVAAHIHDRLQSRAAITAGGGSIDVFGALLALNVTLLFRPLDGLLGACGGKRAAYEVGTIDPFTDIPIYEPGRDRGPIMGGPCLSHVSFKLLEDHALMLTGFYRSHFYIERVLGNLFGLAHLQNFVAEQAGIPLGPLVCHSSMAQLDVAPKRWTGGDVRDLIEQCSQVRCTALAA
jgi:hypothetical protein